MPKTNKDIMIALFTKMAGPDIAKLMYADFEQKFSIAKKMNEPISDEYYQKSLKAIEVEGPAFMNHLLQGKFPDLPPGFGTKN